jgi:hypothetical protein
MVAELLHSQDPLCRSRYLTIIVCDFRFRNMARLAATADMKAQC